jgi:hypothetical protein
MMANKLLTDDEMFELLPTISLDKDKPKVQTWLTQTEALKVMRKVEDEILKRLAENTQLLEVILSR